MLGNESQFLIVGCVIWLVIERNKAGKCPRRANETAGRGAFYYLFPPGEIPSEPPVAVYARPGSYSRPFLNVSVRRYLRVVGISSGHSGVNMLPGSIDVELHCKENEILLGIVSPDTVRSTNIPAQILDFINRGHYRPK